MKMAAEFSQDAVVVAEATLAANGIICTRKDVLTENFIEDVQLYVEDADYDRAVAILEAMERHLNATIDLSNVIGCPKCDRRYTTWIKVQIDGKEMEILVCPCSGSRPVAIRDATTKIGGIYADNDE